MLKLLALVIPLGLDTFAVSAALGVAGLERNQRLRISILFAAFEGVMPIVGLIVGSVLSLAVGHYAEWAAVLILIGVGATMILSKDGDEEKASLLARSRGLSVIGLGVSVSLDELAVGFTLGLVRVPLIPAIALIALQAAAVSQIGLALGSRAGESVREGAEKLAGLALILLGIGLGAATAAGVTL